MDVTEGRLFPRIRGIGDLEVCRSAQEARSLCITSSKGAFQAKPFVPFAWLSDTCMGLQA